MKRFIILVLAIAVFTAAFATAEGVEFRTAYFTLQLPEGWETSTDMDDMEETEGVEWLGLFADSADIGLVGIAYLVHYENLEDISLWNADDETMEAYKEAILEDFEDDDPELIGTVMAGKIPLIVVRAADEDGEYIYADTMTNGYAIQFRFMVTDPEGEEQYPVTDGYLAQIEEILATFTPVT